MTSKESIVDDNGFFVGKFLPENTMKILSDAGYKNSVDQILLIMPKTFTDPITQTPEILKGYGLYYRIDDIYTYFSGYVYLFDVKEKKVIRKSVLWNHSELRTKRPLSKRQKKRIYEYVTEGINHQKQLDKWKKIVFQDGDTKEYRNAITSQYKEENSGFDSFDEDLHELNYRYLNPAHHEFDEYVALPKDEQIKIKLEIQKNITLAVRKCLKSLYEKPSFSDDEI